MRSKFAFAINGRLSSLLLLSQLITNAASSVVLRDAAAFISNPLVDYKQCSHGDEEWRICLDSEGFAFASYCIVTKQWGSRNTLNTTARPLMELHLCTFTCIYICLYHIISL